jgi:hypothetical protein
MRTNGAAGGHTPPGDTGHTNALGARWLGGRGGALLIHYWLCTDGTRRGGGGIGGLVAASRGSHLGLLPRPGPEAQASDRGYSLCRREASPRTARCARAVLLAELVLLVPRLVVCIYYMSLLTSQAPVAGAWHTT